MRGSAGIHFLAERKFAISVTGEEFLDDEEVEPDTGSGLSWVATATALWKDRSGRAHAVVTYAEHYPAKEEAESAALAQCKASGGTDCKIGDSINGSCVFITAWRTRSSVGWVQGTNLRQIAEGCAKGGRACAVPLGGCPGVAPVEASPTVVLKQ